MTVRKDSEQGEATLVRSHLRSKLQSFLLSTNFQCGLQLTLGIFLISLIIFVRALTFPQACLSATLYIVCSLLVSQDTNVGTRLLGCSIVLGSCASGMVLGGCFVSMAKQVPGWQPHVRFIRLPRNRRRPAATHAANQFEVYTAVLCVLSVLCLGALSSLRVGQHPPFLWVMGMVTCLAFGLIVISGQFAPTLFILWHEVVAWLLLDVAIAAVVAALTGILVLPRLAVHELRTCLSSSATGIGASISRYASRLTVQDPGMHDWCRLGRMTSGEVAVEVKPGGADGGDATDDDVEILDNEMDDEAFVEWLHSYSDPTAPQPKAAGQAAPHMGPPASVLWPKISRAKACIPACTAEPAIMTGSPFNPGAWGRVAAAAEELLERAAALELLIEEKQQVLHSDTMAKYFGADKVPMFQKALAQVAAGCVHVAVLLNPHTSCKVSPLGKAEWDATREELAEGIKTLYSNYWQKVVDSASRPSIRIPDALRVRAIFFAWVLTKGLVDGVEELERAALAATAPPAQQSAMSWIKGQFAFMKPIALVASGLPVWGNLAKWLAQDLPHFFTPSGFKSTVHSRTFQAGVKYWLALSTALLLILGLSAREEEGKEIRKFRPVFGYIAACLCMSEKVEATMSKVALWIVGVTIGGTLGFVVMLDASLATNPYALMVIICVFTLMTGFAASSHFRMAAVLTLMTFLGLILCQYKGCCDATGSTEFYAMRVLAVIFGCSIPVLLNNTILPWYNSQWALGVLGSTFKEAARAADDAYAVCFREGRQNTAAAEAATHQQDGKTTGASGVENAESGDASVVADKPRAQVAEGGASKETQVVELAETVKEARVEAPEAAAPAAPQFKAPLRERIAQPLVAVQVGLIKDGAIWSRGLLATPKIVPKVMIALFGLMDRLTALQLSLSKPSLTGEFSGWAFAHILLPVDADFRAVLDALLEMAEATAQLLKARRSNRHALMGRVEAAVDALDMKRIIIRRHVIEGRRKLVKEVMTRLVDPDDLQDYLTHPDDFVRVLGFLFAMVKTVDQSTKVARTALQACTKQQDADPDWVK